jgi:hypothetical protein
LDRREAITESLGQNGSPWSPKRASGSQNEPLNARSGLLRKCSGWLTHSSGYSSNSSGPKTEMENAHVEIPTSNYLFHINSHQQRRDRHQITFVTQNILSIIKSYTQIPGVLVQPCYYHYRFLLLNFPLAPILAIGLTPLTFFFPLTLG